MPQTTKEQPTGAAQPNAPAPSDAPATAFAALDALTHAVAILDGVGKIDFVNAAWRSASQGKVLVGREGETFFDAFSSGTDAIDQLTSKNVFNAVRSVLHAGKDASSTQYRRRVGDKVLWFHVAVRRRADGDCGAFVVFEDRTAIREHYTDAVEANRILRDVLDHLPRRAFWKDIEGRILGGNTSFFSDFPSENLVGKAIDQVPWSPVVAHFFRASDERVVETGENQQGLVEIPASPEHPARWLQCANAPLKRGDGAVIGTIGSYVDVTQEHLLRETVRESEERLRLTLEGAEIGTFDYDLTTGRTTYTDRCAQMLLYGPGELGNDVRQWSSLIHPDDSAEGTQRLDAHIQGRTENYSYEKRMLAKDRSWRWIREIGRVLSRAADGTPTRLVGICLDITDEKKSRDRMEKIANRLHLATQASQIGIWEYDYKERTMTWDARLFDIYGQSQPSFDPINWPACIHPEDFKRVKRDIEGLDLGRAPLDSSFRIVRPDGSIAHVRSQGAIEKASSGRIVRAVGTTLDVTAATAAAEAVLLGKQQLETFVDNAPAAVAMFDKEMRYIVHSRRWSSDGGLGTQSLVGKTHFEMFPTTDVKWRTVLQLCCAGETLKGSEERVALPDGSARWINWEARPWHDHRGEIGGAIVASEDVTSDIEIRRQLEVANKRLGDFVATASDWLWECDGDRALTYVSERFYERSGYDSGRIVGKPLSTFAPSEVHQARDSGEFRRFQDAKDFRDVFFQLPLDDGSLMYLRISGKAQHDAQGKFAGYLGTASDVTDAVRQGNAAKQAQKLQAVGTLASGVAHEFNNILAIIRGYADLTKRALERGETSTEDLNHVIEAAARGSTLTKGLLAFGRKSGSDDVAVFDLGDLVSEQRMFLRPLTGPHFELVVEKTAEPTLIRARRDGVAQALMNLVLNARDASSGGRIGLAVDAVDAAHVVSRFGPAPREGRFVRVSVSDSGAGMGDAILRRIFEPFFTTKEVGKGTGLGLHFVYQLVVDCAGYLNVASEVGKGTVFSLFFPEAQPVHAAGAATADASMRYAGLTAFVVDDEPALAAIYRAMLEDLGFAVASSSDPETALEIVDNHIGNLDLIVSDVLMPKLEGPRFAELAAALHPEARVLFVTGQAERGAQAASNLPAGAFVLRKPFTRAELAAEVANVFQRRAMLRTA